MNNSAFLPYKIYKRYCIYSENYYVLLIVEYEFDLHFYSYYLVYLSYFYNSSIFLLRTSVFSLYYSEFLFNETSFCYIVLVRIFVFLSAY